MSANYYYKLWICYANREEPVHLKSRDRPNKRSPKKNRTVGLKRFKRHIKKQIAKNNCRTAIIYDRQTGKELYKYSYGLVHFDNTGVI